MADLPGGIGTPRKQEPPAQPRVSTVFESRPKEPVQAVHSGSPSHDAAQGAVDLNNIPKEGLLTGKFFSPLSNPTPHFLKTAAEENTNQPVLAPLERALFTLGPENWFRSAVRQVLRRSLPISP